MNFAKLGISFALSVGVWALLTASNVAGAAEPARQWADSREYPTLVCRATFSLRNYESMFEDVLRLQKELNRVLGIPLSKRPTDIYLFQNENEYGRFVKQHFPKAPKRRALFVNQNDRQIVLAYRSEQLATDLRHESTHAFLHASLPMVPLWLDEGLAEYFEVPFEKRAWENSYLEMVRWNARFRMVPEMEKLEKIGDVDDLQKSEYRYSWAWVHFFFHGSRTAHKELVNYLADIQRGVAPGRLSERIRKAVPEPRSAMLQHFRDWKR